MPAEGGGGSPWGAIFQAIASVDIATKDMYGQTQQEDAAKFFKAGTFTSQRAKDLFLLISLIVLLVIVLFFFRKKSS